MRANHPEILEGSFSKVEEKQGFLHHSRTSLLIYFFKVEDKARIFSSFLGHFEVETRPSRTSGSLLSGSLSYFWAYAIINM